MIIFQACLQDSANFKAPLPQQWKCNENGWRNVLDNKESSFWLHLQWQKFENVYCLCTGKIWRTCQKTFFPIFHTLFRIRLLIRSQMKQSREFGIVLPGPVMLFATVVQWCNFWEIWSVPEMKCVCLCEFTKVLLFVGFEELHVFHEIIFLEIHFFLHFSCKNLSTIPSLSWKRSIDVCVISFMK